MSVKEIETAIANLPPADLAELAEWFEEFQARAWDERIARDARQGRLDSLVQRAKEQVKAGQVRRLMPGEPPAP